MNVVGAQASGAINNSATPASVRTRARAAKRSIWSDRHESVPKLETDHLWPTN